jgi:ribosomal protein L14
MKSVLIDTVQVIDNSGALVAECVNVLKKPTSRGLARIGE